MTRRLATIAIALGTVGFGVSSTPAFAAQRTPLAQNVEQAQDSSHLQLYENLHTTAGDHKAIRVLIANAEACEEGASLVARTPAIKSQQAAKAQWLSGERLQARMDVQYASAIYLILSGDRSEGFQQVSGLGDVSNRVDTLTSHASMALGL